MSVELIFQNRDRNPSTGFLVPAAVFFGRNAIDSAPCLFRSSDFYGETFTAGELAFGNP